MICTCHFAETLCVGVAQLELILLLSLRELQSCYRKITVERVVDVVVTALVMRVAGNQP